MEAHRITRSDSLAQKAPTSHPYRFWPEKTPVLVHFFRVRVLCLLGLSSPYHRNKSSSELQRLIINGVYNEKKKIYLLSLQQNPLSKRTTPPQNHAPPCRHPLCPAAMAEAPQQPPWPAAQSADAAGARPDRTGAARWAGHGGMTRSAEREPIRANAACCAKRVSLSNQPDILKLPQRCQTGGGHGNRWRLTPQRGVSGVGLSGQDGVTGMG